MDNIGIEAISAVSGDIHNLSVPAFFALVLLVLILAALSSIRLRERGLHINHLFLKANYTFKDQSHTAFVRGLGVDQMRLVVTQKVSKGDVLELDLSSLPEYPIKDFRIKGTVSRVRSFSRGMQHYIVQLNLKNSYVNFDDRKLMSQYIELLQA